MANVGYLGGDVSGEVRFRLVQRYLKARPAVTLDWHYQCRCGQTRWTWWRKCWYCVTCGRRVRKFMGFSRPSDAMAHEAYTAMLLAAAEGQGE